MKTQFSEPTASLLESLLKEEFAEQNEKFYTFMRFKQKWNRIPLGCNFDLEEALDMSKRISSYLRWE